jgi:protein-S-isoprenylcysteine O-methyltransferase Ste14
MLAYWLVGALSVPPARKTEGRAWSVLRTGLTIFVFVFLFSPSVRVGWLGERFVPHNPVVAGVGVAMTALGIGLAVWARYVLGRNWSAAVSVKHSHELIRAGPYAGIRHPIYSGVILALLGTALVIGEWRALVAIAVLALSWFVKAKKEEALLSTEFGPAFDEHRSCTGMFLPRFRRRR